jgi:hypothetical protein
VWRREQLPKLFFGESALDVGQDITAANTHHLALL